MTAPDILERLEHVRKGGAGWTARCPAHEDKKNSLSVKEEADGKVLLHCFAGCTFEQIIAAIGSNNGQPRGKGTDTRPRFNYTDGEVTKLCEALIDEWKTGGEVAGFLKTRGVSSETSLLLRFGATHRTFEDVGSSAALAIPLYHDNELVGVKYRAVPGKDFLTETGSSMSGLYGRPDPRAKEILLLEGPLDVALAMSHGFNAVGIQAADTAPTKPDLKLLGQYPTVFLIGDNDRTGREAMNKWHLALSADSPEPLVRVSLGYKDIGDLYAFDPPNFRRALAAILRQARASRDYFEPCDLLSETELRGVHLSQPYAVERLVPRQQITMLFGEEKSGKSLLATYFGKCVANHVAILGKYPTTPMPVLYLDLENTHYDLDQNAALFARLGPVKLTYRTRQTGVPALDSPGLIRYCEKHKPLIILDSQTKFAGAFFARKFAGKGSQWNPDHMSGFYDELLDLCAAGATVVIVHHCTRDEAERYANSYVIGANVARAFAVVSEDRPQLHRVRLQGILFRGAEPVSEQLLAFPVITDTGHFGLSDLSETPIDRLVKFVQEIESKGGICTAEQIKARKGIGRNRSLAELNQAVNEGRLFWPKKRGPVSSVRENAYGANQDLPYAEPVRSGTEDIKDDSMPI